MQRAFLRSRATAAQRMASGRAKKKVASRARDYIVLFPSDYMYQRDENGIVHSILNPRHNKKLNERVAVEKKRRRQEIETSFNPRLAQKKTRIFVSNLGVKNGASRHKAQASQGWLHHDERNSLVSRLQCWLSTREEFITPPHSGLAFQSHSRDLLQFNLIIPASVLQRS